MDRADADAARCERAPDVLPIGDVLEADELPADGPRLIDQDAAGDGDAGTVVFDTFVSGGFDV